MVAPEGDVLRAEIGDAVAVWDGMVGTGRAGAKPWSAGLVVVVSSDTGVPNKSGTSVWVGPAAGGGTGRPPVATVVELDVDLAVVVVVGFCVVEVVVDAGGTAGVVVVVLAGGVVVLVVVWANTSPAVVRARNASAPKSTGKTRRTVQL
jgi:hypothetical protein